MAAVAQMATRVVVVALAALAVISLLQVLRFLLLPLSLSVPAVQLVVLPSPMVKAPTALTACFLRSLPLVVVRVALPLVLAILAVLVVVVVAAMAPVAQLPQPDKAMQAALVDPALHLLEVAAVAALVPWVRRVRVRVTAVTV